MIQLDEKIRAKAAAVQLAIFDVDGVLTDGTLSYTDQGETVKHFNVKDGLGIRLLLLHKIEVGIITARDSEPLARRVRDLGINLFYSGQDNKLKAFQQMMQTLRLTAERTAYVGDDMLDLPVMRKTGLAIAVQDAYPMVKAEADWVTPHAGGNGAVRDTADLLLASRMDLQKAYESFLTATRDDAVGRSSHP